MWWGVGIRIFCRLVMMMFVSVWMCCCIIIMGVFIVFWVIKLEVGFESILMCLVLVVWWEFCWMVWVWV